MRRFKKLFKALSACVLLFIVYTSVNKEPYSSGSIKCENGCTEVIRIDGKETAGLIGISAHNDSTKNISVLTDPIHPAIVIYNRVPKCGSSSMRFLIKRLRLRNRFNHRVHSWPNVKQYLTADEEKELVAQIMSFQQPVLFLRHLHYVDFEKYGALNKPVYINVIRNPVDRFVSHYYFSRYGFEGWEEDKIKRWLWPMSEEKRNMTLEQCVDGGADKCVADNKENLLAFFCGQHKRCRIRDAWALDQAKKNIERNYAFIGILERIEDSMKVAEAILPRYFKGMLETFRLYPDGGKYTKTARKKNPSRSVRNMLEKSLSLEMQLYEFVKERFIYQYNGLKAKGLIT